MQVLSSAVKDLTLQVDGMTCATCVGKVKRTLDALPLVHGQQVNLATEHASFTTDDPADLAKAAEALAKADCPVVTDHLEFNLDGLPNAISARSRQRSANLPKCAIPCRTWCSHAGAITGLLSNTCQYGRRRPQ
jgi:copper chaperone CopZ